MKPMDRRRFLLATAAATAAASPTLRTFAQTQSAPSAATLTLHPESPLATVPANFIGLSYEVQQLSEPDFFSPENAGLIAQFRTLAPHGVLRLGGNTSDVGWWKPTPSSKQPPLPSSVVIVPLRADERPFQQLAYAITPQAVRNLRGFLDATGWTCLYGINLGTNTPGLAADQAVFVARTLGWAHSGGRLEYFQIGNEPDDFPSRFRARATWNANAYFDEWLAEANAIRARVPYARFGLPDTGGSPQWYAVIVDRLLALHADGCPCTQDPSAACSCVTGPNSPKDDRPHIAALTHHYYFGGPPSNPKVNIQRLLQPDPRVLKLAHDIHAAAGRLNAGSHRAIPYRMTEGNTCYRGGKPGVSDVFAATLWAADYLLLLASLGYSGVNLHGGSGKMVADSLGGTLPGELLMPNPKVPHARPFYTPIDSEAGHYTAEPVYYGMLFAQKFAGAELFHLDFDPRNAHGPVDATAYAAKLPTGQIVVAIINKDASQDLPLNLPGYSLAETLTAASLTSTTVNVSSPSTYREASTVPHASAALLYSAH